MTAQDLPTVPPAGAEGEYWFLTGVVASAEGRDDDAVEALARAVELRPLNREIRAQYCETLRTHGDQEDNEDQAAALRAIQEIELLAKNPGSRWDAAMLDGLIERCRIAGTTAYVVQLQHYQSTL